MSGKLCSGRLQRARGIRTRILEESSRSINPNAFLGVLDLCDVTGTCRSYWDKLRGNGNGPPYVRMGRQVRYRWRDFLAWSEGVTSQSTSEPLKASAEQPRKSLR